MDDEPQATLTLLDWRRQVTDLYRSIRSSAGGPDAWLHWRAVREQLFRGHPQTPVDDPSTWDGLAYFDHDPSWRLTATVEPTEPQVVDIAHSAEGSTSFRRIGVARVDTPAGPATLDVWWLGSYGGGLFVPIRDATAGMTTYGGGRYLLDTVKGADLGQDGDRLVLDFNYAYHPSCVYSARWSCPLAPPGNVLEIAVPVGERLGA